MGQAAVRQVVQALRAEILAGSIEPGARLPEQALADRFGVSRTPVREALVMLEQEGLAAHTPNCGYVCSPMSIAEMEHTYAVLIGTESLAVRLTSECANPDLAAIRAATEAFGTVPDGSVGLLDLDRRWHSALVALPRNPVLSTVHARLLDAVRRYERRFWNESLTPSLSGEEHGAIYQALASHDWLLARALVESHWRRSITELRRALDEAGARGSDVHSRRSFTPGSEPAQI